MKKGKEEKMEGEKRAEEVKDGKKGVENKRK